MIVATDVHYGDGARAAAVAFAEWTQPRPDACWTVPVDAAVPYRPGRFALRELPHLLALLHAGAIHPTVVIVDGNAWNAPGIPGLGAHLHEALGGGVVVVGVAKTALQGVRATEVLRGASRKPLFVTAVGMAEDEAASRVRAMHGPYRVPTLLRAADRLARDGG